MMNEKMISRLWLEYFAEEPQTIERCTVGQGNYVYIVECKGIKYVARCSSQRDAYNDSIYWLEKLALIDIPVPKVIAKGRHDEYEYLILSYIESTDIGLVYQQLTDEDK